MCIYSSGNRKENRQAAPVAFSLRGLAAWAGVEPCSTLFTFYLPAPGEAAGLLGL